MSEKIIEIDDDSFDKEVLKSDVPVMVDFWAPWCGPCKAIGPIVDDLAGVYGDRVKFAKVNVDENPLTPSKYGIRAIPTLIFFKDGESADKITGMVAKAKLESSIKGLLK